MIWLPTCDANGCAETTMAESAISPVMRSGFLLLGWQQKSNAAIDSKMRRFIE
jgi:hypothetical protein